MYIKKVKLTVFLTIPLLLLLPLFFLNCSLFPPSGSNSHNAMLEKLGVDTDLGPKTDPKGNPVRENYNPLSSKVSTLFKLNELFMAGIIAPPEYGSTSETLIDDGSAEYGNYQNLNVTTVHDPGWTHLPKHSEAGDVDGDGRDEIVIAILNNESESTYYGKLYLKVIDDKENNFRENDYPIATYSEFPNAFPYENDYYRKMDITTGDIDDDGKDETVVTCANDLFILDDKENNYNLINSKHYSLTEGATTQYLRVTTADVNDDGKDEIIVVDGEVKANPSGDTGTAHCYIYDNELNIIHDDNLQIGGVTPFILSNADVTTGDIDNDGLFEIVFSGRINGMKTSDSDNCAVIVMDDFNTGYEILDINYKFSYPGWLHRVENLDADGDGKKEIFTYRYLLDNLIDGEGKLELIEEIPNDNDYGVSFAVGDYNNDHKADIAYLKYDNGANDVEIYGYNDTGIFTQLKSFDVGDNAHVNYHTLCFANVDDDSLVVEYEGHSLLFTDPRVIAVLASPPFWGDIKQDKDNCTTSFGRSTGTEVEKSLSMGTSVGFSIGTDVKVGFISIEEFMVKQTIEASFDWTAKSSSSIEISYTYTTSPATDSVVFPAIPFDVYPYQTLSSPTPEEVGHYLAINVPRELKTFFTDRDFYNANNGKGMDIDKNVLGHTIGNPLSYPRESDINKAELTSNGGFYSDTMTVSHGGVTEIEIDTSKSEGWGMGFDLSISVEAEVSGNGFLAGGSVGFHSGYSYDTTVTNTTIFRGSVGGIDTSEDSGTYSDKLYDWGLFVKPTEYMGQKFVVINYFVNF